MRDTLSPTEFIKIATSTARHYGFDPIDSRMLALKKEVHEKKIPLQKISAADRKMDALSGVLTAGVAAYIEHDLHGINRPVLFSTIEAMPRTGELAIGLHALGIDKSIAEALLIHTSRALLADVGYASNLVRINSLGDRESLNRYTRELTNFLRKRIEELPPTARELMKQHSFYALMHLIEKDHEISYRMPSPLEYLSDQSRKHFRELVEYLDVTGALYEIDTRLLGHHQCFSDALFSIDIKDEETDTVMADAPITVRGGRYDEFVKRLTKASVPATGAVITFRNKKAPSRLPRIETPTAPGIYMVQLGFGPKMKSLLLLEELRKAHIHAHQDLSSDSLGDQLRHAEALKVPYAIILGQKEFVDKSIIVRDMISRSQESIPLSSLVSHLKKITK